MAKKRLKLDIGSGTVRRPGFIGIDCNPGCNPDIIRNMDSMFDIELDEETNVEHIWMDNSIEHFKYPSNILKLCWNFLVDDGVIEMKVPNAQWYPFLVIGWFVDIHKFWNWWMSREWKKERGLHYTLWTPYTAKLLLESLNFRNVTVKGWYLGKQFYVRAQK